MKFTHSDRLERWLGAEQVSGIIRAMQGRKWYGGPIAVHGVPGSVFVTKDGDFIGEIRSGQEMSAVDRAADYIRREQRRHVTRAGHLRRQSGAFGSLSQLIAAATGGKRQDMLFSKTSTAANAIGNCMDLWGMNGQPPSGGGGAAAPGGTAYVSTDAGALGFKNPTNANQSHFVSAWVSATVSPNTLLLYDRLFAVVKTMNSTATQAVTGVPTRYQNTVSGNDDYAASTFCYPWSPAIALAATAHNWTVCQYTDQDGNTVQGFSSIAGVASCVIGGVDLVAGNWFLPLGSAGDLGVKALTQMQCSALVATGTISFVLAHPIAFFPCPIANLICPVDGLYTAFNLERIYDNACLNFLEMPKSATTATTYSGQISLVSE